MIIKSEKCRQNKSLHVNDDEKKAENKWEIFTDSSGITEDNTFDKSQTFKNNGNFYWW